MVCASEGDDPNDINHTSLRPMTFTFQFSAKSFTAFDSEKDDSKEQYKELYTKNDSESDGDTADEDELYFYGDNGTDELYIDSEDEESDANDSGSSEELLESGEVVGNDGEDTFSVYNGGEADTDLAEMDNTQEASNSNDEETGKTDPIINGVSVYEAEKASYVDFWNYDAVNWYTKEDQLAVEDALQSQLIIVDSMGF